MPHNEISFADLPIRSTHLAEYFDLWMIESRQGLALFQSLRSMDWPAHMSTWREKQAARTAERAASGSGGSAFLVTKDGVAVIELTGTLMKQTQSGDEATSTILARRQLRMAARDPDVKAILLSIDSPGGTAAGTADLADDIVAADKIKPVEAYIADCGCSAAYWLASQCRSIAANRTAAIGSIGTYTVVEDMSGAAEMAGIKVHVVRADGATFKGTGEPGTEITPEQLAQIQKRVNAVNTHFTEAVAKSRKWSAEKLKELADGRVFTGEEARSLGLIDRVESLDATLGAIAQRIKQNPTNRGPKAMSTAQPERVAATLADLKQACPGASSDFLMAQLEKNSTVAEAMTSLILAQSEALKTSGEKLAASEAKVKDLEAAAAVPAARPGHPMPKDGPKAKGTDTTDPVAAWNEAVKEEMAAGKTQAQAIKALAKSQPELHTGWLNAVNSAVKRPTFAA